MHSSALFKKVHISAKITTNWAQTISVTRKTKNNT